MKYESELIKEIVDSRGHEKSSLHYESECIESWIEEAKGAYPKLCDYQSEWLEYISILDDTGGGSDGGEEPKPEEPPIGEFPYETVTTNNTATVNHVVPLAYKSAILKGNTLVNLAKNFTYQSGWTDVWGGESKNNQRCCYQVENVKGETKYFLKNFDESTQAYIRYYDNSNDKIISNSGWLDLPTIITTPTNTKKISVTIRISINNEIYTSPEQGNKNIVVEYQDGMENMDIDYFEGMQSVKMPVLKTTNEDGTKTNILTVNEDVTLRGIGDVRDELNLLNGELTQNIGEAVLSTFDTYGGSTTNGIYLMAKTKVSNDIPPRQTLIIDANKFITRIQSESGQNIQIHVSPKEDGTYPTRDELRKYLSQNPLTLYYIPTTSTVKTVELSVVNQDGEPLSKIKPIEGTMHIEVSGTPINPTAVLEVPVEAITQNLASFINEE